MTFFGRMRIRIRNTAYFHRNFSYVFHIIFDHTYSGLGLIFESLLRCFHYLLVQGEVCTRIKCNKMWYNIGLTCSFGRQDRASPVLSGRCTPDRTCTPAPCSPCKISYTITDAECAGISKKWREKQNWSFPYWEEHGMKR